MNRWDHLDVVVTVGICATILGAGIFFFAFGGAPSGITERFVEPAPAVIDQEGVAQTALGGAIVEAQTLQYMEDVPFGLTQTRLGNEIVAATRTSEARAVLIPYLQEEARESLMRMQGMIQERAERRLAAAGSPRVDRGRTAPDARAALGAHTGAARLSGQGCRGAERHGRTRNPASARVAGLGDSRGERSPVCRLDGKRAFDPGCLDSGSGGNSGAA